jgi:hypothetical protein
VILAVGQGAGMNEMVPSSSNLNASSSLKSIIGVTAVNSKTSYEVTLVKVANGIDKAPNPSFRC